MSKILIKNVELITDGREYASKYIGIEDTKIAYIGSEEPAGYETAEVIDGSGKLAAPGMVNTHGHAAMSILRSYADDLALMDWLQNHIWPIEGKMVTPDFYWGNVLAVAEMLKTGTTCFADMYFEMEECVKACMEGGIRANLSRGLLGGEANKDDFRLKENVELFKAWHGKADDTIHISLGPHAPYTCSPAYLEFIASTAKELGCELQMHLSETQFEVDNCIKEHGLTPIGLAEKCGILEAGCIAAHCVAVTDADLELMQKYNVRVAHNPQSNLKLASGGAPVDKMVAKGILVGIGTDGCSSNNNLDMLEETRLVAMLHKGVTKDPVVIPAREAFDMATYQGAQVLGFKNLGKLEVGYLADIVLYDMNKPWWHPRNEKHSLLVYSAQSSDCDTVIVNGKVVVKKGEVLGLDLEKAYAECDARAKNLAQK